MYHSERDDILTREDSLITRCTRTFAVRVEVVLQLSNWLHSLFITRYLVTISTVNKPDENGDEVFLKL